MPARGARRMERMGACGEMPAPVHARSLCVHGHEVVQEAACEVRAGGGHKRRACKNHSLDPPRNIGV